MAYHCTSTRRRTIRTVLRHQFLAVALVAATLAAPARAATCFDAQLPQTPWAAQAAAAAVRLVASLPDGRPFASASGMVVAGSAATDGHNRILTAAHVARTLQEHSGAWLAVFSSGGRYLGRAGLAAHAAPGPAFGLAGSDDVVGLRFGDAAVLEMLAFAPGGEATYAAIAGVPLAAHQPRALLQGQFARPAGVDHGVSGAGVVADGTIIGVMAFKAQDKSMPAVRIAGGDAARPPPAPSRTIKLPREAQGFAQPVIDPSLLAALGGAGRAVEHARAMAPLAVFVPGFISNACIGFRATMAPA
jgi:hypothetical protein